jgi:hypothetical protein
MPEQLGIRWRLRRMAEPDFTDEEAIAVRQEVLEWMRQHPDGWVG